MNFRCDFCHWPSRRRFELVTRAWLLVGHERCMYAASTLLAMPETSIVMEVIPSG